MSINVSKHAHTKTNQVSASSESMGDPLPVGPLVTRLKIPKLHVRSFSHLLREHRVVLARVEKQRHFALLDVDLPHNDQQAHNGISERRTSRSSGLSKDGWVMTATLMMFSKARSNTRRAGNKD